MYTGSINNRLGRACLIIAGIALVSGIIYSPYMSMKSSLRVGDVADQTIRSPQYLEFQTNEDVDNTKRLRTARRNLITPIYTLNTVVKRNVIAAIIECFTNARHPTDPLSAYTFLTPTEKTTLQTWPNSTLIQLEQRVLDTASAILEIGIKQVNPIDIQTQVRQQNPTQPPDMIRWITLLCQEFLEPNLIIDQMKTDAMIQDQLAAIQPFVTRLTSGQVVISTGETVTDEHIQILNALNLHGTTHTLAHFLSILIIVTLTFLLFERFLFVFYKKMRTTASVYMLSFTLLLFLLLIARIILSLPTIQYIDTLYYLIPAPVMIILLCTLLSPNIAMISGTIAAILIATMYQNNMGIFLFLFAATCATTLACHTVHKRSDLIIAGHVIGIVNVCVIIATGVLNNIGHPIWYFYNTIIGFSSGFICAMLSLAFLPYVESTFRMTTSLGLIETANLNHPLLKKLLLNAPGTYQHSLMVANLSEAAAESIGADVILSRIGAYFHDIGKMKRPIFFSENQFSARNPHENLSPRVSTMIIAAHAKDGVELAQKFKLPMVLQNIMMEHHGTSLVSFFYTIAKKQLDDDSGGSFEDDFRYPGPKPQSKESGIIMLADATEAAIRSIDKPTLPKISNMIHKVFMAKITDQQLDESGLSLNDIQKINTTFLAIFKSIYHSRLDYENELGKIIQQTKGRHNDE